MMRFLIALAVLAAVGAVMTGAAQTPLPAGVSAGAPDTGGTYGAMKGDVDCNGTIDAVDGLRILRYVAGLNPNLPAGCPPIGSIIGETPTPTPTPTPTATPAPSGYVTARKSTWRYDTFGAIRVQGEVYNGLGAAVGLVKVTANFYSASNQLLTTDFGYACLDAIPAGGDSPYTVLLFSPPPGVDHVTAEVTNYYTPPLINNPPVGLQINVTNTYTDSFNYFHVIGTVNNTSSNTYEFVKVCSAFYNSGGDVVDTDFTYADPDTLGPGASGTFHTWRNADDGITSYRLWADGNW